MAWGDRDRQPGFDVVNSPEVPDIGVHGHLDKIPEDRAKGPAS